jgi:hypothetical protein
MIKPYALLVIFFLLLLTSGKVLAQRILVSDKQQKNLNDLSAEFNSKYQLNKVQAQSMAKKFNWPVSRKSVNGEILLLQGVTPLGFPVYLRTHNNTISAASTSTNLVQPGGSLGLNLSGSSTYLLNKLAMWDGGAVLAAHQEFSGKAVTIKDGSSSVSEHSTHVAGTMIAKGTYAPARGMSFGAGSLLSYDFNSDVTEMTAAASGLLLSNHSYGNVSGWDFNDTEGRWEWNGLPGDTEDYTFGFYDNRAQAWDRIAYNAPYYLIVESAGNSRTSNGPAIGATYWGYRSRTDQTMINKGARPAGISSNDGYDIISTSANAKNILTVGAVQQLPFGPSSRSSVAIGAFSSWGPTDDGRIKPDICGMGVDVLSTGSNTPTAYTTLSGTSMSAPNVTGSLYLLQEYFARQNSGNFMKAATLKGLACHTAFDAGNVGPDYIYGWGLLNTAKVAQAITDKGTKSMIAENTLQQGQMQTFNVIASGSGPLAVTISWTDPQGAVGVDGAIDNRTPKLVNDLDVRVNDGVTTFNPWILDPERPANAATTGNNIRDNVEQVYIAQAVPGRVYAITVSHKGSLSNPQAYALIATGIGGTAYCASAPTVNADSKINNVTFANLNTSTSTGCTTYTDHTDQTAELEQGKTYPLSLTLGTCGANFNKVAKVYIDWNGDGDFTDSGELVATTGVINATGTYVANVTVPGTVIPDAYSLMRVVLVETNNDAFINPCGTYNKGETQDYRVHFTQTSIDAGVLSVNAAVNNGACAGNTSLTVRLKNYGTVSITNIPVTVTITATNGNISTFTQTYTDNLPALAEEDFTLNSTFNALAGSTYTIKATVTLSGDPVSTNNEATATIVTGTPPVPSALSVFYCDDSKQYLLSGTGDGQLLWYRNTTDILPIAYGTGTTTTETPANDTFYAGIGDFVGKVGPANKNVFLAGGYGQYAFSVYVSAKIPLLIQSARLYIGNSGRITFRVTNASGQIVSTSTINAIATRTVPLPGAQANDPNDPGQVYPLNLSLPAAGNYTISVSYPSGSNATLFRNNGGVSGYPFNISDIFSITGNNGSSANPSPFYYYFYDVMVKSAGCASVARVPVKVTKPMITQNGNVLSSNFPTGNQWYFNGLPIDGATGQTYRAIESGDYEVHVLLSSGCTSNSEKFRYALVVLNPDPGSPIGLTLFPVPTNGPLNVAFQAPEDSEMKLSLVNSTGQIVYSGKRSILAGNFSTVIDVSSYPAGTYVLKVTLNNKNYAKKVIILK